MCLVPCVFGFGFPGYGFGFFLRACAMKGGSRCVMMMFDLVQTSCQEVLDHCQTTKAGGEGETRTRRVAEKQVGSRKGKQKKKIACVMECL